MSSQETTCQVQNWPEYNAALVERGSLAVWISEEAVEKWEYDGPTQQGAQYGYTDLAIKTCLEVKLAYGLTLRQTEGFVRSVFEAMGLDLDVPDYTLLSGERQGDVEGDLSAGGGGGGEVSHLVMDSRAGLKVHGEGEWKQRTHGKQKRRTWRKLHVGVDADTGRITATVLTDNTESDAAQVESLLEETESGDSESEEGGDVDGGSLLAAAYADGAYDTWDAREAITSRAGATPVIPPQKNAKIKKHGNCAGPFLSRARARRFDTSASMAVGSGSAHAATTGVAWERR
jgi:hypothetical protein